MSAPEPIPISKSLPYLKGFEVTPNKIDSLGVVTFTDGRNEVTPNQLQCEAYGYTYNEADGTCSAFKYNSNLGTNFVNENNNVQGTGNVTDLGTSNTYIMGDNNSVKGDSRNNIIIGSGNDIANGTDNAFVFGTKAQATAKNSLVLGGNQGSDNLAERQSIQLLYGTQTTAGSNVHSYLNNTTNSYFAVPDNTIFYFHADVVAVRVGGSAAGSVGDYGSWVERGVIINKSGTVTVNRERDIIKRSGTNVNTWQPTGIATGTNFAIRVRGFANETIEWNSNVTLTQITTGVAL
jgi:hypothetical protein